MVPVYASESIISLAFPKTSLACDILRNCYEAFALYAFGSYLIACLGGEDRVIQLLEDESRKMLSKPLLEGTDEKSVSQSKSFCNFFLRPYIIGKDLLTIIKFGLVQYMILKTICAFLSFLLELFGVYGNGGVQVVLWVCMVTYKPCIQLSVDAWLSSEPHCYGKIYNFHLQFHGLKRC
ncbi:hypothetical protein Ancab_017856 [Ancistrocladus abbreviatus]